MKTFLEFYNNLKIPLKISIGVFVLVPGFLLFAQHYILDFFELIQLTERFRELISVIFLFAVAHPVMYFLVYTMFILKKILLLIKRNYIILQRINELTKEECQYVIKCYSEDEFFYYDDLGAAIAFDIKWKNILTIPTGAIVQLYAEYKITTKKWIVKIIKRKLQN